MPETVTFATKPKLATGLIARAIVADVPCAWVAGDSVYGVGEVETALRRAGKGYGLGVNANHVFRSWHPDIRLAGEASDIADALPTDAWVRLSAGYGTKGERLYDWVYRPLADLDAAEYDAPTPGLWTRGLLIRSAIADGERASFTTWAPQGPSIEILVRVEGARWRVEEGFETTKTELGLDHNESRSWHGWHRHVCLVMLAYAVMTAVRSKANAIRSKKQTRGGGKPHRLVGPGHPTPRHETGARRHPHRPHHRLVNLPTLPPQLPTPD